MLEDKIKIIEDGIENTNYRISLVKEAISEKFHEWAKEKKQMLRKEYKLDQLETELRNFHGQRDNLLQQQERAKDYDWVKKEDIRINLVNRINTCLGVKLKPLLQNDKNFERGYGSEQTFVHDGINSYPSISYQLDFVWTEDHDKVENGALLKIQNKSIDKYHLGTLQWEQPGQRPTYVVGSPSTHPSQETLNILKKLQQMY
jgi:hypothetical protein